MTARLGLAALALLAAANTCLTGPLVETSDPRLHRFHGQLFLQGEPLSGCMVAHDREGRVRLRGSYRDGSQEGRWCTYFANGALETERFYRHDKKVGLHRGWWESGRPKFEYHFRDDQFDGLRRDWYREGQLCQRMHYRDGKEIGEQTILQRDGRYHSHYVVASDGRRYGLINSRSCRPGER